MSAATRPTDRRLSCVVGRFQPFHVAHLELVLHALTLAESVVVGITNPDERSLRPVASSQHRHRRTANPYSYLDRARMIGAALRTEGVAPEQFDVVPFPLDPACTSYVPIGTLQLVRVYGPWEREKVALLERLGYPVLVLPGQPEGRVSGTDIRAARLAGESWRASVPSGALAVLDEVHGVAVTDHAVGAAP